MNRIFKPTTIFSFLFILFLPFFIFCTQPNSRLESLGNTQKKIVKFKDTSYVKYFGKTPVNVFLFNSQRPNGNLILVLPGWNYPVMDWKQKTHFVDSALNLGYSLLLVDMGKSVYMDSIYQEARMDYKTFPTRTWLWDEVLKPYQKNGWFCQDSLGKNKTAVIGLSTGARGAVLFSFDHYRCFQFVIALSGDYDNTLDTADALLRNSMGPYWKYTWRWKNGSNQIVQRRPLYSGILIAHGLNDKIVNPNHSKLLETNLRKLNVGENGPVFTYYSKMGGHTYEFWNESSLKGLRMMDNYFKTFRIENDKHTIK